MAALAKPATAALPAYAELHCLSNFTFLRGAAHADELVQRAIELGYSALAITDECSVAGVVRAYAAIKAIEHCPLKLIVGSEFTLECGVKLLLLATDRASYGKLVALITSARRAAKKGEYRLTREMLEEHNLHGCLAIWLPTPQVEGRFLKKLLPDLWIGVELLLDGLDSHILQDCQRLATELKLPLVACGDVHMARENQRPLQDTITAIRLGKPLRECGTTLFQNAERHLRNRERLAKIYPAKLLAETINIADRCNFNLGKLGYEYPQEIVPEGHTPTSWLRELTYRGAAKLWPAGLTEKNRAQLEYELKLIAEQQYEPFFLTVEDVVRFARSRGILCQGRGSAANSAVCYALGITAVDPARSNLLFERFISKQRAEPPDIDVDFEHERREEVIQYIYKKYGRHRAALAATVISYRARSAIRDVGNALAIPLDIVDRLAKAHHWFDSSTRLREELQSANIRLKPYTAKLLLHLVRQLLGTPRHLSQHVGGFVIARDNLSNLVPVENASMADRTVIQWDKDDLESLGLLKVDVLALGMLTALQKSFDLVREFYGHEYSLDNIPPKDSATFTMIQKADTVGVFQIESRAQMTMLPRLKPANFYDLVIEIAIVRPGPIQGDMVHPYLARRKNPSLVEYPSEAVKHVLERTLGVPIFQEQVMQLAMVAADFTAGEADQLRRAMAAWKRKGGLEPFRDKLFAGMKKNAYPDEFAERIYKQILGFGDYGFPESHSASFALLAYASCYLKCHYPAAFTCALLNSQPMGFYQPSQLVQDLQRHGVEVRPVDVQQSDWLSTLERKPNKEIALRLGLHRVKGLSQQTGEKIVAARHQHGAFSNLNELSHRSGISATELEPLAAANALQFTGHRFRAFWEIRGIEPVMPLLPAETQELAEAEPLLAAPSLTQTIAADYRRTGLSLEGHPLALLRDRLNQQHVRTAAQLWEKHNGAYIKVAGLVIARQRPGSAKGVMFMTLEDETGNANIVVWSKLLEQQRQAAVQSQLLLVKGKIQHEDGVLHVIANQLEDLSHWARNTPIKSRNFH